MTTNNTVNVTLSGQTGTANFVGSTSPTITTPVIAQINDASSNPTLVLGSNALAVNYLRISNEPSLSNPTIDALGSDTNISITLKPKADAGVALQTAAVTANALQIFSGTTSQHRTDFAFSNTAQTRVVTFPDASGTVAFTSNLPTGAALTKTDDTNVTLTLGGSPTTALLNATSLTLGWTGTLGLTRGGTAASLTASNGGIVYSTASAMAILAGTATAGQMLQSGASTTPVWSTTTYPATNAINTIMYASSANVLGVITPVNSAVMISSAGGVPSMSTTLPSGIAATNMTLTTPSLGVATATSINFGGTALSVYSEGTWTPIDASGASLSFTSVTANYTRIGRMITASCTLTYPATVDGTNALIGGLPFATSASSGSQGGHVVYTTVATLSKCLSQAGSATFTLNTAGGGNVTNAGMSLSVNYFQIIYFV